MSEAEPRRDRVEVLATRDGREFYWTKTAPNGETLSVSETFTRRPDAVRAARREATSSGAELADG